RRMQQLRKDGYTRAVRMVLDPAKLGIGISAYILLTMKSHAPEAAEAFRKRVLELDEVLECQKLTGAADMILKIATHDLASFDYLLTKQLLGAPEVATAQSSIILEDSKSTTSLPLRFALD
ncbi:MAG: Lrp/AsnC family transcriptional regulator, partial [Novosphingobium sp.]|nr:Lrp/AsnC family transcriptional regulator [Novosphingobium sp.]